MATVITGNKEKIELAYYIAENLTKTDGREFRDVYSVINYTANIIENISRLINILFEKKLLGQEDIKHILNDEELEIINEQVK